MGETVPSAPLPGEPGPAVSLLGERIKTPGPNRQKGLKKTFVYHEYEGKRSRGGKLAGRQRRDGVTWRFHLHCTQGCGRRGRLCSRLTDR